MPAAPATPIIEPPAAMTPVGDVFKNAMTRLQAGETEESIASGKKTDPPEKPVAEKPVAEKKPAKPPVKSALDAALGGDEQAPPPTPTEDDPLKEFPENAKDANWKKARELIGKQHGELKELRTKNGKHETDPAITAELSTLRQQLKEREGTLAERDAKLAEYNDAMTAINLELHPDHRREFIDGRKELVAAAASKVKSYGGSADAFAEALGMSEGTRRDDAIEEVLTDFSESAKAKILRSVAEIETLDERRAKAMKNPQQSFEELERKTLAARAKQAEQAERIKTVEFDRIAGTTQKSVPTLSPVDESIEGAKEWNSAVRQAREDAFKLFGEDAAFPDLVATAIKGKDYDRIAKMLIAERKESATLRAQLAEFDGSMPDMKTRKPPAKSAADAALEKTPGQIYKETMAKMGGGEDI